MGFVAVGTTGLETTTGWGASAGFSTAGGVGEAEGVGTAGGGGSEEATMGGGLGRFFKENPDVG